MSAAVPVRIAFDRVSLEYPGRAGPVRVVDDVSFAIAQGEFVSIIGPSGCGKTTMMNMVAGFVKPTAGRVTLDGKPIAGPGPDRGVIFQEYGVFPWLTVRNNIAFGLTLSANRDKARAGAGAGGAAAGGDGRGGGGGGGAAAGAGGGAGSRRTSGREAIVERYMRLMGLADFADAFPKMLSGGMRQRLAIARAYAVSPEFLLMDEPFGALDAQTRTAMQDLLLDVLAAEAKTVMLITHSVEEALYLSSRIVVMTARPTRIREIVEVPFAYPRTDSLHEHPLFGRLRSHIRELVMREYAVQAKQTTTMIPGGSA